MSIAIIGPRHHAAIATPTQRNTELKLLPEGGRQPPLFTSTMFACLNAKTVHSLARARPLSLKAHGLVAGLFPSVGAKCP